MALRMRSISARTFDHAKAHGEGADVLGGWGGVVAEDGGGVAESGSGGVEILLGPEGASAAGVLGEKSREDGGKLGKRHDLVDSEGGCGSWGGGVSFYARVLFEDKVASGKEENFAIWVGRDGGYRVG